MRVGKRRFRFWLLPAFIGGAISNTHTAGAGNTPAYQVLYSFTGINGDGASPNAPLLQAGPLLYGTSQGGGGGNQYGTVFSFDPFTKSETPVYTFLGGSTDGRQPTGTLIQSASNLYGTTIEGGTSGGGTIFDFNTSTHVESTLYSFGGYMGDGFAASGSLVQSGAKLYGVTNEGGGGYGTIFEFDTTTNAEAVLYSFKNDPTDGIMPVGSLILSNSTLYGIAGQALFQFDLTTNQEKILHFFGGAGDGNSPTDPLLLSGSKLYGLTLVGGEYGDGALYDYDLATNTETVLYSFAGGSADGKWPEGGLVQSGPMLYGMTESGGLFADGTVFAFDTDGNTESSVESLDTNLGDLADGSFIVSSNTLYGTTRAGGADNGGTIVSFSIPEPSSLVVFITSSLLFFGRRK
jgi:uncharacterized repeat protein (TIGR03803 family)